MDPQPKGALAGPGSGVEGVRLHLTLWPSVWGGVLLLLMVPVLRSAENGSAPSTASELLAFLPSLPGKMLMSVNYNS